MTAKVNRVSRVKLLRGRTTVSSADTSTAATTARPATTARTFSHPGDPELEAVAASSAPVTPSPAQAAGATGSVAAAGVSASPRFSSAGVWGRRALST